MKNTPLDKILMKKDFYHSSVDASNIFEVSLRNDRIFDSIFNEEYSGIENYKDDFLSSHEHYTFIPKNFKEKERFIFLLSSYVYIRYLYLKIEEITGYNYYPDFQIEVNEDLDIHTIPEILWNNDESSIYIELIANMLFVYFYNNMVLDIEAFIKFNISKNIGYDYKVIELLAPYHYYEKELQLFKCQEDLDIDDFLFKQFLEDLDINSGLKKSVINPPDKFIKSFNSKYTYEWVYKAPQKILSNNLDIIWNVFDKSSYKEKVKLLSFISKIVYFNVLEVIDDFEICKNFNEVLNENVCERNFDIVPISHLIRVKNMPYLVLNKLTNFKFLNDVVKNKKLNEISLEIEFKEDELVFIKNGSVLNKEEYLKKHFDINYFDLEEDFRNLIFLDREVYDKLVSIKRKRDNLFLKEIGININMFPLLDDGTIKTDYLFQILINTLNNDEDKKVKTIKYIHEETKYLEEVLNINNENVLNNINKLNVDYLILETLLIFNDIKDVKITNTPLRIKNIIKNSLFNYNVIV